jgi:hypothetical protein
MIFVLFCIIFPTWLLHLSLAIIHSRHRCYHYDVNRYKFVFIFDEVTQYIQHPPSARANVILFILVYVVFNILLTRRDFFSKRKLNFLHKIDGNIIIVIIITISLYILLIYIQCSTLMVWWAVG